MREAPLVLKHLSDMLKVHTLAAVELECENKEGASVIVELYIHSVYPSS